MEIELERINRALADRFGFTENQSNFRVIWSEDEFEKRKIYCTKDGFQLLSPVIQEVPKYKQWIQSKYILERLTIVPDFQKSELVTLLSYEPLWVFETKSGDAIQPSLAACYFIINQVMENIRMGAVKQKDPDAGLTKEQWIEKKDSEIKELEQALFGNETDTTDALAYREGVVVPHNYKKVEIN